MSLIALNGLLLHPPFSGVETSINQLAEALAANGTERYIFYVPHAYPRRNMHAPHFETRRVPLTVPGRIGRLLWEQLRLPHQLMKDGVDLLHAPGYLAPLRCPKPVVLTVYDLIALRHPHWCRLTNRLNYRFMLPRSIRLADRIVVPSEVTRRDVADRFPEVESRIRVVPLAVSEDFRRVTNESRLNSVTSRYGLPERFVLFVGNLEPKKNISRLLMAWRSIRDQVAPCKLVLAGRTAWDWSAIRRKIFDLDLTHDVRHTEYVDYDDLPTLFSLAEAFAFPSLHEGFGLPPLEAMACGVPVVTSTSGALPEVTGDAAIHVDPLDVKAIGEAIVSVVRDRHLRQSLIDKGHQRVSTYTWSRTAAATERVYGEVLQSRSH